MAYSTHTSLRMFGQKLGYYKESHGICSGISLSYLEATFTNQTQQYFDMVQKIKDIIENKKLKQFVQDVTAIQNKVKNFSQSSQHSLSPKEEEILQILAFYERITLYQYPQFHSEVFNNKFLQCHIEEISKIASSATIEIQGGLKQIFTNVNAYEITDLTSFLAEMAAVIDNCELQENEIVGFRLGNINHAIALTYNPKTHLYTLFDSNMENTVTDHIDVIADAIFTSYQNASDYRTFSTDVIVLNSNSKLHELQQSMNDLKKRSLQNLNLEMAERISDVIFIAMAIIINDIDTVRRLLELGADISMPDAHGITPLMLAAENGYTEIVELLVSSHAQINAMAKDNSTAISRATKTANHEIMQLLLDNGADPNYPGTSPTPLEIAIEQNDEIATELLLLAGAVIYKDSELIANPRTQTIENLLFEFERNAYLDLTDILQEEIEQDFPTELTRETLEDELNRINPIVEAYDFLNKQFMFTERFPKTLGESYKLLNKKISDITNLIETQQNIKTESTLAKFSIYREDTKESESEDLVRELSERKQTPIKNK